MFNYLYRPSDLEQLNLVKFSKTIGLKPVSGRGKAANNDADSNSDDSDMGNQDDEHRFPFGKLLHPHPKRGTHAPVQKKLGYVELVGQKMPGVHKLHRDLDDTAIDDATRQARELYAQIALISFVPFRKKTDLVPIGQTWWSAFLLREPTFDDEANTLLRNWQAQYRVFATDKIALAEGTHHDDDDQGGAPELLDEVEDVHIEVDDPETLSDYARKQLVHDELLGRTLDALPVDLLPRRRQAGPALALTHGDVVAALERQQEANEACDVPDLGDARNKLDGWKARSRTEILLLVEEALVPGGRSTGAPSPGTVDRPTIEQAATDWNLGVEQKAMFVLLASCILQRLLIRYELQDRVWNLLLQTYPRARALLSNDESLFLVVQGIAGAGKSRCVLALVDFVRRWDVPDMLVILSTTASSAALLGGVTYHKGLGLYKSGGRVAGDKLAHLRNKWQTRWLVVIDEVGMLGEEGLGNVEAQMRNVTNVTGKPFGGRNVALVGDFGQLGPVKATPMFQPGGECAGTSLNALAAYKLYNENPDMRVLMFEDTFRQDDERLAAVLSRGRWGDYLVEDLKLLNTRCLDSCEDGRSRSVPVRLPASHLQGVPAFMEAQRTAGPLVDCGYDPELQANRVLFVGAEVRVKHRGGVVRQGATGTVTDITLVPGAAALSPRHPLTSVASVSLLQHSPTVVFAYNEDRSAAGRYYNRKYLMANPSASLNGVERTWTERGALTILMDISTKQHVTLSDDVVDVIRNTGESDLEKLCGRLSIIIGERYLLRHNVCAEHGLTNGQSVVVEAVVLQPGVTPSFTPADRCGGGVHVVFAHQVEALLVRHLNPLFAERQLDPELPHGHAVMPPTRLAVIKKTFNDVRITVTQFALVWGRPITGHVSQGQTLSNGMILTDPKRHKSGFDGWLYVVLSRMCALNDLWMTHPLPEDPAFFSKRLDVRRHFIYLRAKAVRTYELLNVAYAPEWVDLLEKHKRLLAEAEERLEELVATGVTRRVPRPPVATALPASDLSFAAKGHTFISVTHTRRRTHTPTHTHRHNTTYPPKPSPNQPQTHADT